MDLERFNKFRHHAEVYCKSSAWLTDKMIEACGQIEEALVDDSLDHNELQILDAHLRVLQNKAAWEDREAEKFKAEYKDMINYD